MKYLKIILIFLEKQESFYLSCLIFHCYFLIILIFLILKNFKIYYLSFFKISYKSQIKKMLEIFFLNINT